MQNISARKSKTPNRKKVSGALETMATKLKKSVFELTREETEFAESTKHQKSDSGLMLKDLNKTDSND